MVSHSLGTRGAFPLQPSKGRRAPCAHPTAGVGRGPEKQEAQHQIKLGECGKIERVLWASVSSLPSSLFESAEPAWENDVRKEDGPDLGSNSGSAI